MIEITTVRTFESGVALGIGLSDRAQAYFVARREGDAYPWKWFVGTFPSERVAWNWILEVRSPTDTSKSFRPRRG